MHTTDLLNTAQRMVEQLNTTNSKNDKMAILADYPELQNLLTYTYDPYRMYGVSSTNLKKNFDKVNNITDDLFELLDMLSTRKITGHDALAATNGFIEAHLEYRELIYNILDKNLKTRTDAKLINKVYPKLVPQFDVTLAHKYEDHAHKIDWDNESWSWSRKLDGVRVIARKEDGKVTFYSRRGKEFETLNIIKAELESMIDDNFVLDGEMCVIDKDGNEDYKSIVSQIKRKNYTILNAKYMVFDCLTLSEFDNAQSEVTLSERLHHVEDMFANSSSIEALEMNYVENVDHVIDLLDTAVDAGWEGIMLRRDCEYEGKRTRNLLKCKKMMDAEYIVEDFETGPFRVIDKDSGLETTIETLANVIIEHKGNAVSVGSGFSLEERIRYYKTPSQIIGKEITVQYFEESKDKDGKLSLRFPVVKHIFESGKREI